MLCFDKTSYNLRNRPTLKRKQVLSSESCSVNRKRLRHFDYTSSLPDELLLHVFSYLTVEDLYYRVRLVCRKWRRIAMLSSVWREVVVGNEVPSCVLRNWISPGIKRFAITDRNDADAVLEAVSKHAPHLEDIKVENCWGSPMKVSIRSSVLCNLLKRCKKLNTIHFERVRIRSSKFFKLLAKRRNDGEFLHLSYEGPITSRQYNALKESCSGWVFTEFIEIV